MVLWFYDLSRYGAEHPVDVLHRPKRSIDIKVERQLHDMQILGRIVGCCVPVARVQHQP